MNSFIMKIALCALPLSYALHADSPDISNLDNCIEEVRQADLSPPEVPTFDQYFVNYKRLIDDLEDSMSSLPYVYQEVAAKPLISYLKNIGEYQYLRIFRYSNYEGLQQLISDASLAILFHQEAPVRISAFQEVISDLYDRFICSEKRTGKETGLHINPPAYGIIPPLVKFGNAESGPYTWPGDVTSQVLGMGCAIVSLPPAQLEGGLLAWTALGHETGGHNVTHADENLLQELGEKVNAAIMKKFDSQELADYWTHCIDESVADVCGYLHMGPSIGIGLVGYFRSFGNGRLSTIGYKEGPHPIGLLRGYLAAAVAKRLHFEGSSEWSEIIASETSKDNGNLRLVDSDGYRYSFPVSLEIAIASTEIVAQTILRSILPSIENHSLQGIQDWQDRDQNIVEKFVHAFKTGEQLPKILAGPGFFAAHVVAAATQAALENGAQVKEIFGKMQNVLAEMHLNNPLWAQIPTPESIELLEQNFEKLKGPVV
ncbi:MAG TPA: hypothetical protein VGP47_00340, partial [Parachlamydiaceae bacterium]|nr:hypothetical protein [Parachlamydiaceae bacterium]